MKYAIISDIHANAVALNLVLASIKGRGDVVKTYCLGDIVGLHTEPGECIDLLREHRVECIGGNHEAGVTKKLGSDRFPRECWESIVWTRERLSPGQLRFLESLEAQKIVEPSFWLMHGVFGNPDRYLAGWWKTRFAVARLHAAKIRFGFFGHTHVTAWFISRDSVLPLAVSTVSSNGAALLEGGSVNLINPGTVGHPRTNDPFARFVILDTDEESVSFEAIGYDYTSVVRQTLRVFPGHAGMYERFGTKVA